MKGYHCILFVLVFIGSSCKNDIAEAMQGEGTALLPIQTTYDAEIKYTNNGIVSTRLFSPRIDRYSTKDTAYILMNEGFRAVFYDSLGVQTSELKAKKGVWYEQSRIMVGQENVKFTNNKGENLFTKNLTWYQDSATISTSDPVKIVRKDGVIYGKGLEAAEDFSSYSIHQITGELYVNDDDSTFSNKDSLP